MASAGEDQSGAMRLPVLEDLPDVTGRRVLVRCDFNVPILDGHITNDLRVRAALPTLTWLVDHGAQVTACTHLGRPKGRRDPRFDVAPVRAMLEELVPGVDLLDNLRFDPGEEAGDPAFIDRLVDGQDCYVNDAFGSAHRAHASIVGPPARLPSAAGRLMVREVNALSKLIESPQHPFVAVLGGAKISDKLGLIGALLDRVDTILVGGAMCFTFLAASGLSVGDSPVEADRIDKCRQLLNSGRILVPMDFVLARSADRSDAAWRERDVPDGWAGFDIGPESAAAFGRVIASASTVLWNGPMGVFEDSRFAAGTDVVATAVAACSGFTVVGGGDTIAAVAGLGLTPRMGYVSTGGGATLEFVERGDLPGLQALRDAARRVARS